MTHSLIAPIRLHFDTDWDRIDRIYNQLVNMKDQGKFRQSDIVEYRAEISSLGQLGGSLITSDILTKPNLWNIWTGDFLEKLLPQSFLDIKQQLIDSGFNFVNFAYTHHYGPIAKHIDGKTKDESHYKHCNINYIISTTDLGACTLAMHETITESYQSIPGTTWLIDTTVSHEIKNTGYRKVFQLKIHNSFAEVKQFFEDQGLLG